MCYNPCLNVTTSKWWCGKTNTYGGRMEDVKLSVALRKWGSTCFIRLQVAVLGVDSTTTEDVKFSTCNYHTYSKALKSPLNGLQIFGTTNIQAPYYTLTVPCKFQHLKFKSMRFFSIYCHQDTCFVLLTQYRAGDKIKKNEMGWACGAYGWGEAGV